MREKEFKAKCRGLIKGHWQTIETTTTRGVPDVNVCFMGVETWLEFKVKHKSKGILIRPEQRAWIMRRHLNKGRALVIAYDVENRSVLIFDRVEKGERYKMGAVNFWRLLERPRWSGPLDKTTVNKVHLLLG